MKIDFDKELRKLKRKMKEFGDEFEDLMIKGEKAGKRYGHDVKKEFVKLKDQVSGHVEKFFGEHDIPGKVKHAMEHMKIMSDVEDKGSHIEVNVSLPGVQKKDVILKITTNHIEVLAHRKEHMVSKTRHGEKKVMHERYFERHIPLPGHVEHEKAKANFKDGVLTIVIPKKKVDRKLKFR